VIQELLQELRLTKQEYQEIQELTGFKPEQLSYFRIEEIEDAEQECSYFPPNTHEEVHFKVKGDDILYVIR
jgi:nicotinic acid phosphoribosyltransferase